MVLNQASPNTLKLIGTHRRTDAAAADGYAAVYVPSRHRLAQRNHEIGVIIFRRQGIGAEINDLMPGRAQAFSQVLFQFKPTMVGGDAYTHNEFPKINTGRL